MRFHSTKKQENGFWKSILKVILFLGLFFFAVYFYRDSLNEILSGIRELSLLQLGISGLLALGFYVLEGHIIYLMASPYEASFKWKNGIIIAYLCEFYRILTLGNGAGISEIYYLKKNKIPIAEGTGITLLQYVMKKIAVMLLGITGFIFLLFRRETSSLVKEYGGAILAGCIMTVGIVFALIVVALSVKVKQILLFLLDKLMLKLPKQQENLEKLQENLILLNTTGRDSIQHKKRILMVIGNNLIKLFLGYMIPAFILIGESKLSFIDSALLMALCFMLAGVLPAPSGLGSLEFVFLLLFGTFVEEGVAVPAILMYRFMTWIVPFLIGGSIYIFEKIACKVRKK